MKKSAFYPLLVAAIFAISCNTSYKAESIQYSNYRIQQISPSNGITSIIKPYGDSVNKLMNAVIGYNESQLERKKQGNTLGYFITDAYLEMARQKMDPKVDIAFMNTGGVRLPDLAAGAITLGKIYELMPFDNLMMLVKMKGSLIKQYLDTLAASDGIIESGMTMQVANKTVQQIMIGGKPLDMNAEYTIVHSDYVIINTNLLKNLARKTNGYLLRDALIDYVKLNNNQGKKIKVSNIDRITYVN
jgi:2',3'-cyclic-nucleotide 2'-phosphodiesterase (5'-nucleotidase family)